MSFAALVPPLARSVLATSESIHTEQMLPQVLLGLQYQRHTNRRGSQWLGPRCPSLVQCPYALRDWQLGLHASQANLL